MATPNEPDGGPIPKWMRRLDEKLRISEQAAAYPRAVPGDALAETSPDRSDSSPSLPPPPQDPSNRPTSARLPDDVRTATERETGRCAFVAGSAYTSTARISLR